MVHVHGSRRCRSQAHGRRLQSTWDLPWPPTPAHQERKDWHTRHETCNTTHMQQHIMFVSKIRSVHKYQIRVLTRARNLRHIRLHLSYRILSQMNRTRRNSEHVHNSLGWHSTSRHCIWLRLLLHKVLHTRLETLTPRTGIVEGFIDGHSPECPESEPNLSRRWSPSLSPQRT